MELLVGNQKACKKELKTALEIYQKDFANEDGTGSSKGAGAGAVWGKDGTFIGDPNDKNAAALVLKAQLECQRRNYSKSLRLLGSCHASDGGLDPVRVLRCHTGCSAAARCPHRCLRPVLVPGGVLEQPGVHLLPPQARPSRGAPLLQGPQDVQRLLARPVLRVARRLHAHRPCAVADVRGVVPTHHADARRDP